MNFTSAEFYEVRSWLAESLKKKFAKKTLTPLKIHRGFIEDSSVSATFHINEMISV